MFRDGYCDNRAGQAVQLDDITNVQLIDNHIVGRIDEAFSLQNNSTGATIRGNRLNPAIGYEVGIDDSSEQDYLGPNPAAARNSPQALTST